jgi:hypothetical protein
VRVTLYERDFSESDLIREGFSESDLIREGL